MRNLATVLSALLAVLSVTTARADKAVVLGVSLSRSGAAAEASYAYERGIRLWIEEANRQGGVLGAKVELAWRDDGSDPAQAADAYRQLAKEADLLLGPADRMASLAVLPVLEQSGVSCVFPAPASESLWMRGKGYAFGVLSPLSEWPGGFFEIASREGLETAATVTVDHPYDNHVFRSTAKQADRYGVRVTFEDSASLENVAHTLEQARKTQPAALVLLGSAAGVKAALLALRAMRWKPRAVFVSSSLFVDHVSALAGPAAEDVFTALPWSVIAARAYPGGGDFLNAYQTAHGRPPCYLAASAYAGCLVLAAAAAKAGTLDRVKIRQALLTLDTMTIVGRYGVDPAGRQLRHFPLTVQWRKGRDEIVWPEQMRTAAPAVSR